MTYVPNPYTQADVDYLAHYNNHYLTRGLSGSGARLWGDKKAMWVDVGFTDDMTILDYGCGVGAVLPAVPHPANYQGVDISEEAVRLARQEHPGVRFSTFQPGQLDVDEADLAVAHSVFTHCPKSMVDASLRDIHTHMRRFGIVDVFWGVDNQSDIHVTQWDRAEWEALLGRGFAYQHIAAFRSVSGYTHQYYRIAKL